MHLRVGLLQRLLRMQHVFVRLDPTRPARQRQIGATVPFDGAEMHARVAGGRRSHQLVEGTRRAFASGNSNSRSGTTSNAAGIIVPGTAIGTAGVTYPRYRFRTTFDGGTVGQGGAALPLLPRMGGP
ncbi:hypothetical protein [Arthrobacter sp. KK5.5]|uniref:hypothetical protein n=1 Tax=Arthrobacter sp. KK5.5 TaxID=3373084 RepID=UPI003EE51524